MRQSPKINKSRPDPILREASVLAARMEAQGFDPPLRDEAVYPELFRRLQPVSPVAMTYPGNPPALLKRTVFDSAEASDDLRGDRRVLKARFLGGTIGYVLAKDFADYAVVFRKQPTRLNPTETEVLAAVRELGPITPRLLKEETGILARKVGPALAKLQRAFLVFEDQTETNWERGWSTFESAFSDLDLDARNREAAAPRVLGRFFEANVFATLQEIRDWCGLSLRDLQAWVDGMEQAGEIKAVAIAGLGEGWIRADFRPTLERPKQSVHMLHQSDALVRAHRTDLKARFGGPEILQYLLVEGRFRGAVCGHWRIGPHDVDDIVLDLPKSERAARKREILKEVASTYSGDRHRILNYDGRAV